MYVYLKKNSFVTFHSSPLLFQSIAIPFVAKCFREFLMNDLPGSIFQCRQIGVEPLIFNDTHVLSTQFQQKAFLLVRPVLRTFSLLEAIQIVHLMQHDGVSETIEIGKKR